MTREFTTAAKAAGAGAVTADGRTLEDLKFRLDGEDYVAQAPKDTQLLYLVAAAATSRDLPDKIAALVDFMEQVLTEPGKSRFRTRMLDRDDKLGLEDVLPIYQWMIGEWSGRPPTSASAS